jgi:hypothetical protein
MEGTQLNSMKKVLRRLGITLAQSAFTQKNRRRNWQKLGKRMKRFCTIDSHLHQH